MGLSGPAALPGDPAVISTMSPNWLTTRLDFLGNWARANSLWPMPFGTACCAIEFMASAASRFDLSRFGMERMSFSPRQADVLICAGRLPFKLAPVIRRMSTGTPFASVTTMAMFHLFLRASASAASIACIASS